MCGWLREISTPMRPTLPDGSPSASFSHVAPASCDRYSPLPGPPPTKPHALRRRWYAAAKSVRPSASSATSTTPVSGST
jgi:hypothetical protein